MGKPLHPVSGIALPEPGKQPIPVFKGPVQHRYPRVPLLSVSMRGVQMLVYLKDDPERPELGLCLSSMLASKNRISILGRPLFPQISDLQGRRICRCG